MYFNPCGIRPPMLATREDQSLQEDHSARDGIVAGHEWIVMIKVMTTGDKLSDTSSALIIIQYLLYSFASWVIANRIAKSNATCDSQSGQDGGGVIQSS